MTTRHLSSFSALTAELGGGSGAFKSAALQSIREAFRTSEPTSEHSGAPHPNTIAASGLYAGFGNREKDALAYLSAGVPPERVFLIDTTSRIIGRSAYLVHRGRDEMPRAKAGGHSHEATSTVRYGPSDADRGARICANINLSKSPAEQPGWESYDGLMHFAMDEFFPMRCSASSYAEAFGHYSAMAARYLSDTEKKSLW